MAQRTGLATISLRTRPTGESPTLTGLFAAGEAACWECTTSTGIAAGIAAATPAVSPKIWRLTLAYTLGIITPYATGPSPIYFGGGCISSKAFWVYGAIPGAVFLGTLLAVGVPWMMWIGF